MRKILVLLGLGLVALTGCKKDSTPSLVENPVLPPATETFAPGASVTIKGSGFTAADEIWFRPQTKATDDIQATITKQTATEITFIVPQGLPAGEQTVLLKRDDQEMPLGKITVAEATTSTKLYAIGMPDDEDTYVLWEIDKTTGELTEIVKLPTKDEEYDWESPVVDPTTGNIYIICKEWIETENSTQIELYRINPNDKTPKFVGVLSNEKDTEYNLCIVDGRLHALVEKTVGKMYENNRESFYSLVSIDTETAEQTPVADFGSLYQTLDIPGDVPAGIDGTAIYDKTTNSLIVPIYKDVEIDAWQLARFDITNKKIIPGEKFNDDDYISIFPKDGTICGAFQTDAANSVDFRPIDTEKLTAGNSIGSIPFECDFDERWCYDASSETAFTTVYKNGTHTFVAFDFNTQKFEEIKAYTPGIDLYELFQ
ncbi:MAG: DUF4784 family protein [Rikenella sp.]|nr:DUF4784 family protein [Rikenella sp.]